MGLFGKGKSGGLMNEIRCDEQNYLIWKWRPEGQEANSTSRENAIRWGSSLRVKDGEVAVFVYKQKNGTMQDFIEGPFDQIIHTKNFPVLASIVGMAYGGGTPFQADIYFINRAQNIPINFGVPYFDAFDARLPDHGVPVAVRGTITINIADYREFIKINRLINFSLQDLYAQIKSAMSRYVKSVVMSVTSSNLIPLVQIETRIGDINEAIETAVKDRLQRDYGVNVRGVDLSAVEIDKSSEAYRQVRQLTADAAAATMMTQNALNLQNLENMQRINTENLEESLRIQREEAQKAQTLQSQQNFIGAHAMNLQAQVLMKGSENLGQMGSLNLGGGADGGSFNPAAAMTGMMMGGAIGGQMAGMMNTMGQQMQGAANTPPPLPQTQYYVAINGQQSGPFVMNDLQAMVASGQLTPNTLVWCSGMANWTEARNVAELIQLFQAPGGMTPPPLNVP